jgi:hypothetical protein
MTITTGLRARHYDLHAVAVAAFSDDDRVLEAIDLRLLPFATNCDAEPEIEITFVTGVDEQSAAPTGHGRPVYDTPYGTLEYFADSDALCGALAGVRMRCEAASGSAVLQSERFEGLALYLATHPLTTICLMELLERRGLFSLHAGCVALDADTGVLLAGPSGAGKSTLALSLVRAGFAFLGDDVVFLRPEGDGVRVLGFADAIGLTDRITAALPSTTEALAQAPAEGFPKRLARIERLYDGPVLGECVPRALVFPSVIRESRSWIAPLDPAEALLRVVPDVLLTDPRATKEHLAAIGALIEQVQCYEYRSGADLDRGGELLRSILAVGP